MLATFLAQVSPASTSAKPACMKNTRQPADEHPDVVEHGLRGGGDLLGLLRSSRVGQQQQRCSDQSGSDEQLCASQLSPWVPWVWGVGAPADGDLTRN